MRFPFYIARRHLIAKKRRSAVNVTAWIAMLGVAISTMALIIVLSVFNGIENLVGGLYSTLETDLKVVPAEGKTIKLTPADTTFLHALDTIIHVGRILEENAMFGYHERQHIGRAMGIDQAYADIVSLGEQAIDGNFMLHRGTQPMATLSAGVAYHLGASLVLYDPITVYLPNRLATNWMNPQSAFKRKAMAFSSVLSLNTEFDEQTVVLPIEVLQELLAYDSTTVSALAIKTPREKLAPLRQDLIAHFGKRTRILSRLQQNESLYRTMRSERLIVVLILSLILLIATFNVVGSLSMLILDKRADMGTLIALGVTPRGIREIFIWEGTLISAIGGAVGLLLGLGICLLQQELGLVRLQGVGEFLVEAYPVEVHALDVLAIYALVLTLGLVAALITTRVLTRHNTI
ncbi:MAG: hypothetical protein CSA97_04215 [Bacteroidetes bacterium]|nr:MAG: hypothetical protein CSA97_04215 [Bacteroidota bacterium]